MAQADQTEAWVRAARQGDSLALAKLLAVLHPQLRARIEAVLDQPLRARVAPEDVLQDVYLHVFQQIARFEDRGPGSFRAWVQAILDNRVADVRRAAHRAVRDMARDVPAWGGSSTASHWDLLDRLCSDSLTPSRVVRRDEALAALRECLSALSQAHLEVIQWRFLDGLSVAEVAARLGKSEDAVVALSQRALKALRDALDSRGEFTHGT